MKTIIIVGSARKDGHTHRVVSEIAKSIDCDIIDLMDYNINHYTYEHSNRDDDYIPIMKKILNKYDLLIFATPVYWYAMSGIMKVFFDRITDLLDIELELGRKLRGKKMAVVSTSIGNNLGDQFWLPFVKTANYLGMDYVANVDIVLENNNYHSKIKGFVNKLKTIK